MFPLYETKEECKWELGKHIELNVLFLNMCGIYLKFNLNTLLSKPREKFEFSSVMHEITVLPLNYLGF